MQIGWSHDLACRLLSEGLGVGCIVSIHIPRSMALVVATFAVSIAGAAYCIMDPRWPEQWVRDVQTEVRSNACIYFTDKFDIDRSRNSASPEASADRLDNAFAVYHTSGTTGKAKGIIVSHRGVLRTLQQMQYPSVAQPLIMLCAAALPWDMLTFEIWFPLLHGGTCVLADSLTPQILPTLGVTTAWLTASVFNVLVDEGIDCFKGMRDLLIGGERLSPKHVGAFLAKHKHVNLINGYGLAETNMLVALHLIEEADCDKRFGIPIGTPLPSTEIQLVEERSDGALRTVGDNEEGEIAVGGDALAMGYTTGSTEGFREFSPDGSPPRRFYLTGDYGCWDTDGNLNFCGRRDHQNKIYGQMFRPFEIETAVLRTGMVNQCVVSAQLLDDGRQVLVAHVVPAVTRQLDIQEFTHELKVSLTTSIPGYHIPAYIVPFPQLPVNSSGKLDRNHESLRLTLPCLSQSGKEVGTLAQSITMMGRAVLFSENLTPTDDLTTQGLDSLSAMLLASRINAAWPIHILPQDISKCRTANAIAAHIRNLATGHHRQLRTLQSYHGVKWSSPNRQSQWLEMVDPRRHEACLNAFTYRLHGSINWTSLRIAFERIVECHEILRTTIRYSPMCSGYCSSSISVSEALLVVKVGRYPQISDAELQMQTGRTLRKVNIQRGPRLCVGLIAEVNSTLMIIGSHHATLDESSEAIFVQELNTALMKQARPAPMDYRAAVHLADSYSPRAMFQNRLSALPVIKWPESKLPKPTSTANYGKVRVRLDRHIIRGSYNGPHFSPDFFLPILSLFALAVNAVYHRPFGLAVADSGRNDCRLNSILGNFVRLPLVPIDDPIDDGTFDEIHARLSRTWDDTREYYHELTLLPPTPSSLELENRMIPPIQVLLVLQNVPLPIWNLPGIRAERLDVQPLASMFDLTLELWPMIDRFEGDLEYDPAVVGSDVGKSFVVAS